MSDSDRDARHPPSPVELKAEPGGGQEGEATGKKEADENPPIALSNSIPAKHDRSGGSRERGGKDGGVGNKSNMDRDLVRWTKIVGVFTGLLFLAGIAQFSAAVLQWHAMREQLDEMRGDGGQTERIIALQSQLNAAAGFQGAVSDRQATDTKRLADITTTESQTAEQSLVASTRAWIAPVGAIMLTPPAVGAPINVAMAYRNTGHAPATDMSVAQEMEGVSPVPVGDTYDVSIPPNKMCAHVKPVRGGESVFPSEFVNQTSFPPDRRGVYGADLPNRAVIIVWQGCFAYKTLGQAHTSRFCEFLRPYSNVPFTKWAWTPCQTGNSAD
jgi:hypothetical protein